MPRSTNRFTCSESKAGVLIIKHLNITIMETNEVWLAIDKYGRETIFPSEPTFDGCEWDDCEEIECEYCVSYRIGLPKGFIKKLLGRELTFEDSPIKIQ